MNLSKPVVVLALLLVAITQWNCSGCGPGKPPASPPPSVDVAEQPVPRPVVSLALRGSTEATVAAGAPWLLLARVLHPSAFGGDETPSFPVAGESAFSLELRDATGAPVAAAFERIGAPLSGPVVIDPSTELELGWRLPATEAAKLAEGTYTLVLVLNLSGTEVASTPVEITVTAAENVDPNSTALVAADVALAGGDNAAAEALVDGVLAADPEHVQALSRKGELRERAGDLRGAYNAFNDAINAAVTAEPGAPEGGPRHLYLRRSQLAERLDGGVY